MKKGQVGRQLPWIMSVGLLFFISIAFADLGSCQNPPKKTSELLNQGKKIYEQACTFCHGPNGDGKGPLAARLQTPPANFTKPLNQWEVTKGNAKKIFETIANGVPGTAMAKFHYSEEERWALAYRVMEFSKQQGK